MAPIDSIQFIEAALSNGAASPFGLSYTDPDQKWLIREDLLSLLQEFPAFRASIDTFFHDDGTSTNLLVARGSLCVSCSAPAVPITIWLHELYPTVGPMVFVSPEPYTIRRDHPFVDSSSGLTNTPLLTTWSRQRCSLADLVRNLTKLFSKDHPFWSLAPAPSPTGPVLFSKTEALDRLSGKVHRDIAVLRSTGDEEVEDLLRLQEELRARDVTASGVVCRLEREKADLDNWVSEIEQGSTMIKDWLEGLEQKLSVIDSACGDSISEIDSVFEAIDERSRLALDYSAGEMAIEDTIFALDKAVEIGAVSFDKYIRQVRNLARDQFYFIAMRMKLEDAPLS